jgi:hypothetical protein
MATCAVGRPQHGKTVAEAGAGAVAAILAPQTATRMAGAARALIGAATKEQQVVLNPGFDGFDLESPRRHWTYLPELERPGLSLRALSDAQRKLAHELITASVSMEGYAKVVSVMAMEHVRRALVLMSAPESARKSIKRIPNGGVTSPDSAAASPRAAPRSALLAVIRPWARHVKMVDRSTRHRVYRYPPSSGCRPLARCPPLTARRAAQDWGSLRPKSAATTPSL